MKSGYLVIVLIGGDKCLGGIGIGDLLYVRARNTVLVHPVGIGLEILANRSHWQGITAQQFQVVGNVGGTAAELPAQLGHVESNIQDMHLVGQDVIFEFVLEHHDGVIGEGSTDEC